MHLDTERDNESGDERKRERERERERERAWDLFTAETFQLCGLFHNMHLSNRWTIA